MKYIVLMLLLSVLRSVLSLYIPVITTIPIHTEVENSKQCSLAVGSDPSSTSVIVFSGGPSDQSDIYYTISINGGTYTTVKRLVTGNGACLKYPKIEYFRQGNVFVLTFQAGAMLRHKGCNMNNLHSYYMTSPDGRSWSSPPQALQNAGMTGGPCRDGLCGSGGAWNYTSSLIKFNGDGFNKIQDFSFPFNDYTGRECSGPGYTSIVETEHGKYAAVFSTDCGSPAFAMNEDGRDGIPSDALPIAINTGSGRVSASYSGLGVILLYNEEGTANLRLALSTNNMYSFDDDVVLIRDVRDAALTMKGAFTFQMCHFDCDMPLCMTEFEISS
eukprot:TRINITY_DN17345_c0_g1_i1.p1 TRINITY_DN17345_c0_g1~~TRINITY_DN17345_c0_g1_i1.p1  ORF type:complete len:329 (+),score=31.45 TRINITY_DN17345_c0_g1_i1:110-1096(+)